MTSFIYTKAGKRDTKNFISIVNKSSVDKQYDEEKTTVMTGFLDFYADHKIIQIFDNDNFPPSRQYYIYGEKDKNLTAIDYTNETIEKINNQAPLKLDKYNVSDYVRFYLEMVIGGFGKFIVIESLDDIPWLEDPSPQIRKSINALIDEVSFKNMSDSDEYVVGATVLFKSALFEIAVAVNKSGKVNFISKDVLMEDMPVQDISLGH